MAVRKFQPELMIESRRSKDKASLLAAKLYAEFVEWQKTQTLGTTFEIWVLHEYKFEELHAILELHALAESKRLTARRLPIKK